jgi:hypothetical protein
MCKTYKGTKFSNSALLINKFQSVNKEMNEYIFKINSILSSSTDIPTIFEKYFSSYKNNIFNKEHIINFYL